MDVDQRTGRRARQQPVPRSVASRRSKREQGARECRRDEERVHARERGERLSQRRRREEQRHRYGCCRPCRRNASAAASTIDARRDTTMEAAAP